MLRATLPSVLAVGLLLPAWLPSQDRPPEACFPDSSFGVLTFAGLARCRAATADHKLVALGQQTLARLGLDEAALLERPEVIETLDHLREGCAELGVAAGDLRALFEGSLALGVGRPALQALGMPSLCLAIDVRGREAAVRALLAKCEAHAARARLEFLRDTYPCEGVEVVRRRESRTGFTVVHAEVDGWLLVATGTGYLEDCLRALRGKTPSLATSQMVQRGRARAGQPIASLLLNAKPLGQALAPLAPYEIAAVGRSLGIEALEGIYWASAADPTASADILLVGLPGDTAGLLKAPFRRPCTTRLAALCPSDTLAYVGLAIDREAAAAAARSIAAHLPAALRQEIDRELRREVGREVNRELRAVGLQVGQLGPLALSLGHEAALAVSFDRGVPQVTLLAELRDPQRAEALLLETCQQALGGREGLRLLTRDSHGCKLHFVTGRGLGVSPAFAVRDGVLVASPWRTNVETVLARAAQGQPSLGNDPIFTRALESAGPASILVHARMAEVIGKLYGMGRGLLERQIAEAMPDVTPGDILPSAEDLAAAIGDVTFAFGADEAGFHVLERQPFGFGSLLALGGSAFDWLLARVAQSKARRST